MKDIRVFCSLPACNYPPSLMVSLISQPTIHNSRHKEKKMGTLTRATKNLSRRKTRALLIIIALTLALTLLIILPPSINAREALTQRAIDNLISINTYLTSTVTLSATEIQCDYPLNLDPNTMLGRNDTSVWLTQPLMNESLFNNITALPDITNVIPMFRELSTANRPYQIYGIPLENASYRMDPTILPQNITEGRNIQVGDRGVVVLDEGAAENLSASVGDTVTILGRDFRVIGIEGLDLPWGTHGATMSLADAQAITNNTGRAWAYKIFVDSIDNVNTVEARIRSLDPKLEVSAGLSQLNTAKTLQDQTTPLTQAAQNNLNQIQTTGLIEISIAVIADVAIILFIMLYTVRERTKEIGALKAMGASNAKILGQFMLEGVLLSLIAAVIAIVIGVFVLPTLASVLLPMPVQTGVGISLSPNGTISLRPGGASFGKTPVLPGHESNVIAAAITPEIMLLGLGAAVLLGALGSLYPALKAARTHPAEAMRYE
jgi:ABC-type antimicrobial peptide transport system permease subunit